MGFMKTDPFRENVCIVTGASSGIGRELALLLADQGALLVLVARNERRLHSTAEACRRLGGRSLVLPADVKDEAQCRQLVEETVREYGRIDTLINNAGISMMASFEDVADLAVMRSLVTETSIDVDRRIMEVNYYGSVYCTHYALPYLLKTRGRIVGVSSLAGKTGVPTRSFYAASKHAMAGFFDTLRIELADRGVSVTMVYPGYVATEVRERALGPDGEPKGESHIQESSAMTAERCAELIVRAAGLRRRELVLTPKGKLGMWLKLIAPGLLDVIARRTIERGR